jgi:hypothetical protein
MTHLRVSTVAAAARWPYCHSADLPETPNPRWGATWVGLEPGRFATVCAQTPEDERPGVFNSIEILVEALRVTD